MVFAALKSVISRLDSLVNVKEYDPFAPFHSDGLAGIHDQEDEQNRQNAILLARFYNKLLSHGMPKELVETLVEMRFNKMLMQSFGASQYDYQDDEED